MKKENIICVSLFLMTGFLPAKSQEIIDYAHTRVVYDFYAKTNPEQTKYTSTDLMYLDIGENVSKYYSKNEQKRDSIGEDGLKKGLPVFEIHERKMEYKRGTPQVLYNFIKEQKRTATDRFGFLFLNYEEAIQIPQWKIENETKEIAGYSCQKATAHYLGRDWTVYFTTEIPINQGPWKLWGLPGLIVEATDNNGFFQFELSGFEKLSKEATIILTQTTEDKKEYTKMDKETYMKIEKTYYTDAKSFMDNYLGLKGGTFYNADGSVMTRHLSIPHIPLEPW